MAWDDKHLTSRFENVRTKQLKLWKVQIISRP